MAGAQGKLVFHNARAGNSVALLALLERAPPAPTMYKDAAGDSALHRACAEGHASCVQILIDKGADIRARNNALATPLHLAALSGSVEILQRLLEEGAERDALDEVERTPLHVAVAMRHVELVALLLAYGADMGGTILPGGDLPSWDPSGLFRPVQQLAVVLALSRMSALSALSVSAAKGKLQEALKFLEDPEEPHSRLRALLDEKRLRGLQARAASARTTASTSTSASASASTSASPTASSAPASASSVSAEAVQPGAVRALARAEVLLSCAKIAYLDAAIKTAQSLGCALPDAPARALRRRATQGRGGGAGSESEEEEEEERDAGARKRQRKAMFAAVMCVGRWGQMLEAQGEFSRDAEMASRYLEEVQRSVRDVLRTLWQRRWLRPLLEN